MITPIKIFVDGHVFDKEFQGSQTFLKELYTHLIASYPNLAIYVGAENVDNIKNIFPKLPSSNILPYKKRRFSALRLVFDIPNYLKKQHFDFAHFQYISPKAIAGCKYIVTTHDLLFKDFKEYFSFTYRISRNLLFARSIIKADLKITISEYSKHRIAHHFAIQSNSIHVISNGATAIEKNKDTNVVMEVENEFGVKNFILYVSRIEPRKNHQLLLETYLNLKLYDQNISLVFVGKECTTIANLKKLINNLTPKQKDLFFWFDQVSESNLSKLYQACRFFVYPSKAEGFGIPPLEAAMHQKPVLCSKSTAMQDFSFFEPYTFDPSNRNDFEQKIALMVNFPPTEQFIKEVSKKVAHKYSWAKSSFQFHQLLQQKLNG